MNKCLLMNVTGAMLFVGASGCATIGTRPPETVSERTVSTVLEHQRRAGDPTAEIQQDGTMVVVRAIATCLQDDVDVNMVERVREAKHYNASPVGDWWAGIGGGIALGTGALMIATPSTFASNGNSSTASGQPSSGSSGTSSSVSPGAITGLGVGLVVLGAALLTIPVVDAARSSGSDKSVTRQRVPGPVLRRDLSCPSTPMAGGRVSLATVPPISVGVTNQDGMAQVDLARTVADAAPRRGTVNVSINGSPVGHVDLTPLVIARRRPPGVGSTRRHVRAKPRPQPVVRSSLFRPRFRTAPIRRRLTLPWLPTGRSWRRNERPRWRRRNALKRPLSKSRGLVSRLHRQQKLKRQPNRLVLNRPVNERPTKPVPTRRPLRHVSGRCPRVDRSAGQLVAGTMPARKRAWRRSATKVARVLV